MALRRVLTLFLAFQIFDFKETELCFIRNAKCRILYRRVGFEDCHTQMYVCMEKVIALT